MSGKSLKIALVGCGQIADAHLQAIRKIRGTELVAVADRYEDLARQAAARFAVPVIFQDLERMLRQAVPDVVHITTPPDTHRALALQALARGAHVYIEKPFTLNAVEAADVLAAAKTHRRLVCMGHDQRFDPAWTECRKLAACGALGKIIHVESILGYDLSGPFGKICLSDPDHWVHRLPGGLLQNIISHSLYTITDFLRDAKPRLWACWFTSRPALPFPTELRVLLQGAQMTGTLMVTTSVRPKYRLTRVYGTRQGVEIDFEARILRRYQTPVTRGPFIKVEMPLRHLWEAAGSLRRNLGRFLRADLHFFAGMDRLFTEFYRSVREGGEPPIPYAEIRRVTEFIDRIFSGCRHTEAALSDHIAGQMPNTTVTHWNEVMIPHESVRNGSDGVFGAASGALLDQPRDFRPLPGPAQQ
jgi:predicted dehydrogenase